MELRLANTRHQNSGSQTNAVLVARKRSRNPTNFVTGNSVTYIQELYSVSRNTSNLQSTPRTNRSPSDVLAAAGMASQDNEIAMLLWGVTFQGKSSKKWMLVDALESKLAGKMFKERWKGNTRHIVQEVLAHHLHGTCQPCGGRGYRVINDTPMLSDDICTHCGGTGKIPLKAKEPHGWLSDYLGRLTAIAGGELMKKLNVSMDL